MKFLISPWKNEFIDIIKDVKEELFISSPFIDSKGIEIIIKKINTP